MKRIIFILVLFFFGSNICAKEYFVHSPNKRIEVRVNVSNGVRYNVFFNNDTVLKDCSMSLNVLDDEKRIPLRVKKLNRYSVNEKIKKEIPLNGVGSTQGAIPYSYGWFPHVCPRTIRTCSHVYGSPLVSTLLLCFFDFCKTFFAYSNGFTIHK